jgi:hypothetical protein
MCSVAVASWSRSSVSLVLALALTVGCGGQYITRGSELYDDARYVEAAEVFERTEARLASASQDERARFGLYRGATFLKLGDTTHAARWLGYARSVVQAHPDALDADDLKLLDASLTTLAHSAPHEPERSNGSELARAPRGTDSAPAQ